MKKYLISILLMYCLVLNIFIFSVYAKDVEGFVVNITYEYNAERNVVIVHAVSNRELIQKTLPGWILGEDKKTYTAEYDTNQEFYTYFTDTEGKKVGREIVINQIKDLDVNITYEYNVERNVVIVHAVSNKRLIQKTLPGWILDEDKKEYTAEYDTNQTFFTYFTDTEGNKVGREIVINQIDESGYPNVEINYEYNDETNTVVVRAKSDRKLKQKTLGGWVLTEDRKGYIAEYRTNQTFSTYFTDIYGNKVLKDIHINQIDDKGPEITVNYKKNENDNTVTVKVTSNEEMKQKTLSGWILSEDKKGYTAKYEKNETFITYFTDKYGNKTGKEIVINQIDDQGPIVKITYSIDQNKRECVVKVISNEIMKQKTLSGWVLSEDKLTYTAIYTENQMFYTNFTDKWGNVTTAFINISFDKGIDVSQHNGKINWNAVKNAGIAFAIIRCGYGKDDPSQDDPYFQYNVGECERLGIPYGVYLYSYALSKEGAYSEANHALRLIRGHNPTLGVWIDMEDADTYKARNGMPSDNTLVDICDTFCSIIRNNGFSTGVYASLYWLNTKLNDRRLEQYETWVAQWNTKCDYNKRYIIWQYTSSGYVDGILTRVDMNLLYK